MQDLILLLRDNNENQYKSNLKTPSGGEEKQIVIRKCLNLERISARFSLWVCPLIDTVKRLVFKKENISCPIYKNWTHSLRKYSFPKKMTHFPSRHTFP